MDALFHFSNQPRQFLKPAAPLQLCASKDDEVVEYALSRTTSPALIAQYQTQLPDKALLQAKLHEFYLQNTQALDEAAQASDQKSG